MSFYNMLFGKNAMTDLLLAVIGFKEVDVERFRDVHFSDDESGVRIGVYARTGGGNRSDYPQLALYRSPLFLTTEDGEYDSTYASFFFRVPSEFEQDVRNLHAPLEHGIRPEFAQHLAATINREPTEADLARKKYTEERDRISRLAGTLANGHTFVPYDDGAMEAVLTLAEANGGTLLSAWGIAPLVIDILKDQVQEITPRGGLPYKAWQRALIRVGYKWEVDEAYWSHCQERFSSRFPLSMAKIAERVDQLRSRGKAA